MGTYEFEIAKGIFVELENGTPVDDRVSALESFDGMGYIPVLDRHEAEEILRDDLFAHGPSPSDGPEAVERWFYERWGDWRLV